MGTMSCYFLSNDSSTCSRAEAISTIIENIISIPTIGVMMRLSPTLSLVDEYAFYVYHMVNYDRGFLFIAKLCSELTDDKWIPPFL